LQASRQGWPYSTRLSTSGVNHIVSRRATPGGWPASAGVWEMLSHRRVPHTWYQKVLSFWRENSRCNCIEPLLQGPQGAAGRRGVCRGICC